MQDLRLWTVDLCGNHFGVWHGIYIVLPYGPLFCLWGVLHA